MLRLTIPDLDKLISAYRAGESMKSIANRSGISRPTLTRHFIRAGVDLRGRSDAERLKWVTGQVNASRQLSAAWKARRGSRDSIKVKSARAISSRTRKDRIGRFESELTAALEQNVDNALFGQFLVDQQYPEGPYNIDVTLRHAAGGKNVAVEIYTTKTAAYGKRGEELVSRVRYLRGNEWRVLIIACLDDRFDALYCAVKAIALSRRNGAAVEIISGSAGDDDCPPMYRKLFA